MKLVYLWHPVYIIAFEFNSLLNMFSLYNLLVVAAMAVAMVAMMVVMMVAAVVVRSL